MKLIDKKCLKCLKDFKAEARYVKRGHAKFCSRKCSSSYNSSKKVKIKEPNLECAWCNKKFYRAKSKFANSKSGLTFCCREHKDKAQKIGGFKEIMPPHYGNGDSANYRKIAFSHKKKECERCKYNKHPAAIVVHHKDEDRTNNNLENLEVLCANCHSIEHWGS